MEAANRLQNVVQELQLVAQQAAAVNNQVREMNETIDLLAKQQSGDSIYRQRGGILVEVKDLDELLEELNQTMLELLEHTKMLKQREEELRKSYSELIEEIEGSK